MSKDTQVLGANEVAELLSISRSQVNRRAAAGSIRIAAKLPGTTGAYLFDRSEIERIAAERDNTEVSK